jgi:hypothetical protein
LGERWHRRFLKRFSEVATRASGDKISMGKTRATLGNCYVIGAMPTSSTLG